MAIENDFFDAVLAGDAPATARLLAKDPRLGLKKGRRRDNGETFGQTALMVAARAGHVECVRILLPLSNPKTALNGSGWTALTLAAIRGHDECVRLLLAAGGAKGLDRDGQSAMVTAASVGSETSLRALRILLAANRAGIPEKARETVLKALEGAARNGEAGSARQLVDAAGGLSEGEASKAFGLAIQRARELSAMGGFGSAPAQNQENLWACADFLAPFAEREVALAGLARANGQLPAFKALLVSEALLEATKHGEFSEKVEPKPGRSAAPRL